MWHTKANQCPSHSKEDVAVSMAFLQQQVHNLEGDNETLDAIEHTGMTRDYMT